MRKPRVFDTATQPGATERPFTEMTGSIIRFDKRGRARRSEPPPPLPEPPEDDLHRRPDSDEERRDYRHRMRTNAATFVVVALLICVGLWLADTLAQMRKNQDCVLSGRRNCSPITLPEPVR